MGSKLANVVKFIQYEYDKIHGDGEAEDNAITLTYLNGHELSDSGIDESIVKLIDEKGGEGEGDYYHHVFEVNHPKYGVVSLKAEGQYDSWNGVEWVEPSLCLEKEVKVTRYVNIADTPDEDIKYEIKKYLDFSSNEIRSWLNGVLKTSKVVLEFTKVDGEQRVMVCTLNPELIPPSTESTTKSNRAESTTAFRVYDLDKSDWRSVRWDFINKMHIEV